MNEQPIFERMVANAPNVQLMSVQIKSDKLYEESYSIFITVLKYQILSSISWCNPNPISQNNATNQLLNCSAPSRKGITDESDRLDRPRCTKSGWDARNRIHPGTGAVPLVPDYHSESLLIVNLLTFQKQEISINVQTNISSSVVFNYTDYEVKSS